MQALLRLTKSHLENDEYTSIDPDIATAIHPAALPSIRVRPVPRTAPNPRIVACGTDGGPISGSVASLSWNFITEFGSRSGPGVLVNFHSRAKKNREVLLSSLEAHRRM
jgi:hypothetical protein